MFLSLLSKKEKLKFLDLAIYMVDIDGEPTTVEKRILNKMFSEVEDVREEYSFTRTSSIDETIKFFETTNPVVKNIVFLNLVTISMEDDLYNTSEMLFLEDLQKTFKIPSEKRRDLMKIVYEERDLRERASRIIKNN